MLNGAIYFFSLTFFDLHRWISFMPSSKHSNKLLSACRSYFSCHEIFTGKSKIVCFHFVSSSLISNWITHTSHMNWRLQLFGNELKQGVPKSKYFGICFSVIFLLIPVELFIFFWYHLIWSQFIYFLFCFDVFFFSKCRNISFIRKHKANPNGTMWMTLEYDWIWWIFRLARMTMKQSHTKNLLRRNELNRRKKKKCSYFFRFFVYVVPLN